jgi:Family of unknown function (DUF6448)
MKNKKLIITSIALFISAAAGLAAYNTMFAHCDTLDGPVVKAAKNALETGNVNLVLIWVQKKHEAEVIDAFNKTSSVRTTDHDSKEFADMYFYETVVRLHRDGEGEPYTGLKPAGLDMGPAIPAGDKAIEDGSISKVKKLISEAVEEGLRKHFSEVMEKKNYDPNNVEAGREFVKAYVEYIHYIENLYNSAKNPQALHHEMEQNKEEHKLGH